MKDTKRQQRREAAKVISVSLSVLGGLLVAIALWWFLGPPALLVFAVLVVVVIMIAKRQLDAWQAREKAEQDYEDLVRDIDNL